jgi:hypothetical protein
MIPQMFGSAWSSMTILAASFAIFVTPLPRNTDSP